MRNATQMTAGFALCLLLAASAVSAETQPLFHIERSKNANIVQYDANLNSQGMLRAKEPVLVYWIRLAENGEKRDLKWIERKLAYGFKTDYEKKTDTATLKLSADIERKIRVYAVEGQYRAETRIDGRPSFIEKLYIESDESGLWPKVIYIDLYGEDVENGRKRYERFLPE